MRGTLRYTGNNYSMKRNDLTITVRITLKNAAAHDLNVLIVGQGITGYIMKVKKIELKFRCTSTK